MLSGNRGSPDVCVERSTSVIGRLPAGSLVLAGSSDATGVSSVTCLSTTASASSSDVNTFVTEPISNRVLPSGGLWLPRTVSPHASTRGGALGEISPTTIPTQYSPSIRLLASGSSAARGSAGLASAGLGSALAGAQAQATTAAATTWRMLPSIVQRRAICPRGDARRQQRHGA